MAVIQKIRDKYAKLAGGVIVLALVGFILMDATSGSSGGLFRKSTAVGKINGQKIDYTEYEAAIKQRENEIKSQNPNATIDENNQAQIRDQVWTQMVNDRLLNDVNEKLGIVVTKGELNDMLTGANPDPAVKQAFTDPQTGVFNPQQVAATIQQLKKDPKRKAEWAFFEDNLVKRRYASKFNTLVSGAMYIPKFVLDDQYSSRNTIAKINYVKLPYTLVPDDQAKVSDDEIRKYMAEHKAMFEIKESTRGVEFVSFNIVPSVEDSVKTFAELEKIKSEFATVTDMESFLSRNSQGAIPQGYYTKEQLQGLPNLDEIFNAPVNTIVGPFYDGRNYTLAKIEEKKSFPDSVKCRHILVSTQPQQQGQPGLSDTAAKLRIDSVVAMVKGGVSFDSLAARYSDDQGSKTKGGEYEFPLAQKSSLAKEFGDYIFEGHTGESKIVKTEFGYHYIEILKQGAPSPVTKIAFVSKELNVSDNTNDAIYSQATKFAAQTSSGGTAFDKAVKADGLMATPADGLNENSYVVNGLGSSRDLVKWAYDSKTKIGDVSPIYSIGDRYVIAKLANITPAGLAPINSQTRPILENMVRKVKKAKILMDKTKGKGSLEAIAQSENLQVGTSDSVNFIQGFVPGVGSEPKVAGYSFNKSFKENTVSPAIAGQDGVFYISVTGRTAAPAQQRNFTIERQMIEYGLKSNAANMVINGLKESSEVKDTRSKIY
jgi:peptidyl-prolyl cis-trans isomerase D